MATGFVKFFGQGNNRSSRDRSVLDAVRTSGSRGDGVSLAELMDESGTSIWEE